MSRAVEEERAKQPAAGNPPIAEKAIPHHAETPPRREAESSERVKELERQNRDLEIATRVKDLYLEQLKTERGQYVEQLVGMSRYVGELESHERESPRMTAGSPHGSQFGPRPGSPRPAERPNLVRGSWRIVRNGKRSSSCSPIFADGMAAVPRSYQRQRVIFLWIKTEPLNK